MSSCEMCKSFVWDTLLNDPVFIKHNYAPFLNGKAYRTNIHWIVQRLMELVSLYPREHENDINESADYNLRMMQLRMEPGTKEEYDVFKARSMSIYRLIRYNIVEYFRPDIKNHTESFIQECIEKGLLNRPMDVRNHNDLDCFYKSWYYFCFFILEKEVKEVHDLHSRGSSLLADLEASLIDRAPHSSTT